MKVRTLIGKDFGQIKEMPFHVAQACLANGTACHPDAPLPRIRGAKPIEEEAPPVPVVDRMVTSEEIVTRTPRRRAPRRRRS